MGTKYVAQSSRILNAGEREQTVIREGAYLGTVGGDIKWRVTCETCSGHWSGGHAWHAVSELEDGRWSWLDGERSGTAASYAEARSHLSTRVTDPDFEREVEIEVRDAAEDACFYLGLYDVWYREEEITRPQLDAVLDLHSLDPQADQKTNQMLQAWRRARLAPGAGDRADRERVLILEHLEIEVSSG